MSNLPNQMLRPLPPTNTYTIAMPAPSSTPVPLFDVASDTGKFVKGILTHREDVLGKRVYAATDYYTWDDVLDTFGEVYPEAGKDAKFVEVSKGEYMAALAQAGMPEKAQVELYENMAFMYEFGYYGKAGLEESHAVSFFFYLFLFGCCYMWFFFLSLLFPFEETDIVGVGRYWMRNRRR